MDAKAVLFVNDRQRQFGQCPCEGQYPQGLYLPEEVEDQRQRQWKQQKNEGQRLEDNKLCVSEIFVNGGTMLKRIQAAPQGRAHRIRKRSNHVTIVVDKMVIAENK